MAGTDPFGLSFAGAGDAHAPGRGGDPVPRPGSGLRPSMVGADHPAAIRQRAEDERLSKCRNPIAGTHGGNWHDRSWWEQGWETFSHMDPHETLEALGLLPGIGVVFDGANAVLYAVKGDWENAGLAVLFAAPGVGDLASVAHKTAKVVGRADKFLNCTIRNIKCFVAGTLVLTPLGPVPIESIMPGDVVVSVDPETGALTEARVLGVSSGIAAEPCSEVTLDPGDKGGGDLETFTATDGHPFLVVSGESLDLRGDAEHVPLYEPLGTAHGRWVRAAELVPGDTVATRAGTATVVRVAPHDAPEVVYNLHVEGPARYLVGACGAVVHNSPCSEAAEQAAEGAGVVYKRSNPMTGDTYIGQAKSSSRFDARRGEHNRELGVQHDYEILGTARPGSQLDVLEESMIRSHGGIERRGGKLSNKRHQMSEKRYREAGGTVDSPY
jgi:hypothetical protein